MGRLTRILVLTSLYPPHHLGGAELSCQDVTVRLRERGHDVQVLCAGTRVPGVDDGAEEGVERSLRLYLRDGEPWTPPLRERLAIERHNQRVLADALDRYRPDVVSVWHMGAMSLGLVTTLGRRGVPIVYAVCDEWPAYETILDCWSRLWWGSWGRRLLGAGLRPLFGVPTVVPDLGASGGFLWVSELTRQRVVANTRWRYPLASVIYSGIDTRVFPLAVDEPQQPWRWNVVYAGRFDPRKGPEVAIRAMTHLPTEARLALYGKGGGVERTRLEGLVSALGLRGRVSFGEVDRPALAQVFREASVVVFPSEWEEPFGLVPVEAMACGTPVVATGTGGSAEFLFPGENYLQIPRRDPAALAAAVGRLATEPDLRARLVRGGLRTASQLDVEALAEVVEGWLVAAADGYPSGPPPDRPPIVAPR